MRALNAPKYDMFYSEADYPTYNSLLSKIVREDDIEALEEYLLLHPYNL